jgi:hypothetical protein
MSEIKELEKPKKEDDFSFPKELSTPDTEMKSCILYGLPKSGKTSIMSKLPNCLIIDTENGSDKIKGLIKKVPSDKGPVGKMQWLDKFADELIKAGKPYDYVAIDTLSEVNDWAEWSGTYKYMNTTLGKSFNREKDGMGNPIKGGTMLKSSDNDYQSVHTLADGYGYRWSREETVKLFEKYLKVANKCVFFICHVEDKFVGGGDTRVKLKEEVAPKQISLTGKVKDILPRKVDAVGYVYNEDGVIKVNFTGSEERVGGNRCPHLQGYNNVLDWNKIFLK